jgi:hypothetical protein
MDASRCGIAASASVCIATLCRLPDAALPSSAASWASTLADNTVKVEINQSVKRRRKDRQDPMTWVQTSGKIQQLQTKVLCRDRQIMQLLAAIEENEVAQLEASEIRAKENIEHLAERTQTRRAAAAMEKALTALSSHTLLEVSSALRKAQHVHLSAKQRESLQLLEQEGRTVAAYAPQSATIQGILGDVYETFVKSLEKAEHSEATSHRNYEKLMRTKQDELVTMQETLSSLRRSGQEARIILHGQARQESLAKKARKARQKVPEKKEMLQKQQNLLSLALSCLTQSPPTLDGCRRMLRKGVEEQTFFDLDCANLRDWLARPSSGLVGDLVDWKEWILRWLDDIVQELRDLDRR